MATSNIPSIIPNPNIKYELLQINIANSNVITHEAGGGYGIRIDNNRILVFFSIRFKATGGARTAGSSIFCFKIDGKTIEPDEPYYVPCVHGDDNVMRFSPKNGSYFCNPKQWAQNTQLSMSGVFLGAKTNSDA